MTVIFEVLMGQLGAVCPHLQDLSELQVHLESVRSVQSPAREPRYGQIFRKRHKYSLESPATAEQAVLRERPTSARYPRADCYPGRVGQTSSIGSLPIATLPGRCQKCKVAGVVSSAAGYLLPG